MDKGWYKIRSYKVVKNIQQEQCTISKVMKLSAMIVNFNTKEKLPDKSETLKFQ